MSCSQRSFPWPGATYLRARPNHEFICPQRLSLCCKFSSHSSTQKPRLCLFTLPWDNYHVVIHTILEFPTGCVGLWCSEGFSAELCIASPCSRWGTSGWMQNGAGPTIAVAPAPDLAVASFASRVKGGGPRCVGRRRSYRDLWHESEWAPLCCANPILNASASSPSPEPSPLDKTEAAAKHRIHFSRL